MQNKLASRKLWMTVLGSVLATLADQLQLDPETIYAIAGMVGTYVLGQGVVDFEQAKSGPLSIRYKR